MRPESTEIQSRKLIRPVKDKSEWEKEKIMYMILSVKMCITIIKKSHIPMRSSDRLDRVSASVRELQNL